MGIDPETRAAVVWVRDDYDMLVRSARPTVLQASTLGTKWTNRELLFHMWFGQRIGPCHPARSWGLLPCPGGRRPAIRRPPDGGDQAL